MEAFPARKNHSSGHCQAWCLPASSHLPSSSSDSPKPRIVPGGADWAESRGHHPPVQLGLGGAVPGCSMTLEAAFIPQVQQTGSESQAPHPQFCCSLYSCLGVVPCRGGWRKRQRAEGGHGGGEGGWELTDLPLSLKWQHIC